MVLPDNVAMVSVLLLGGDGARILPGLAGALLRAWHPLPWGITPGMMRSLFRLFAAKRLFDMVRSSGAASRGGRAAPRGGFGGFGRRSAPPPRRRFF
jgi:hypothetical protein